MTRIPTTQTPISGFEPAQSLAELFARGVKFSQVRDGDVVTVLGKATPGDAGAAWQLQYDKTSTAAIDGCYAYPGFGGSLAFSTSQTFTGTPGTGRFFVVDRARVDLNRASLADGDDITNFLAALFANHTGNRLTLIMPDGFTNFFCDRVNFPQDLELLEVIQHGTGTITQPVASTEETMMLALRPNNVRVAGLRLRGNENVANFFSESNGLLLIDARTKSAAGGSIDINMDIEGATSTSLVLLNEDEPFDSIRIWGSYYGVNSNCATKSLHMDVTTEDPTGYAYNLTPQTTKTRTVSFGRATSEFSVKMRARYGFAKAFAFALTGASGEFDAVYDRIGYRQDGSEVTDGGQLSLQHLLFKYDTMGADANAKNRIRTVGCHPTFSAVLAEATPGPTNYTTWEIDSDTAALTLAEINNEGNAECHHNNCLGPRVQSIRTGPGSAVRGTQADTLTLVRNTLPNPDVPSVDVLVSDSTVKQSVTIQDGAQAKFENCRLPRAFNWNALTEPTVLNFKDCSFTNTHFGSATPANARIGLQGVVSGLDLTDAPVETLPYLRLDAIGDAETFNIGERDDVYSVNRPVGWKTTGVAQAVRYVSSSPSSTTGNAIVRSVDAATRRGVMVFPGMSHPTTDRYGSLHWDLGTPNATIEAALTFRAGGERHAGVIGRGTNGNGFWWLFLDLDSQTIELESWSGTVNTSNAIESVALAVDTEYVLAMQIDGSGTIRGYIDGVEEISFASDARNTATQWGIKHRDGPTDGADFTNGPEYRYIEVRPNSGSDATERRTV